MEFRLETKRLISEPKLISRKDTRNSASHYRGSGLCFFFTSGFYLYLTNGDGSSCCQVSRLPRMGAEVLVISVDSATTHKEWDEKELSGW